MTDDEGGPGVEPEPEARQPEQSQQGPSPQASPPTGSPAPPVPPATGAGNRSAEQQPAWPGQGQWTPPPGYARPQAPPEQPPQPEYHPATGQPESPAPQGAYAEQSQPQPGQAVAPGQPSDARLAAAMNEPRAQASQTAAPPVNWWEQAPPVSEPPVQQAQPLPAPQDAAEEEEQVSFWRWLWEAAILVILAFAIAFVIKVLLVQPFYIPSGSMEPTLLPGDRVLVNKFMYRFRNPEPGDIIVFAAPRDSQGRDFIKRIVAIEGQTIQVKDGKVYINGKLKEEPYVASAQDHSNFGPLTLSDNNVFVMGDNRTNSSDSRVFGPFNRDRILGEAFVIYWPPSRIRTL